MNDLSNRIRQRQAEHHQQCELADTAAEPPAPDPPTPAPSKSALKRQAKAQRAAEEAARLAAKAEKQAAHEAKRLDRPRLPHGSLVTAVYDAERVQWSGEMRIPGPADDLVFALQDSALFRLMRRLDDAYRKSLLQKST